MSHRAGEWHRCFSGMGQPNSPRGRPGIAYKSEDSKAIRQGRRRNLGISPNTCSDLNYAEQTSQKASSLLPLKQSAGLGEGWTGGPPAAQPQTGLRESLACDPAGSALFHTQSFTFILPLPAGPPVPTHHPRCSVDPASTASAIWESREQQLLARGDVSLNVPGTRRGTVYVLISSSRPGFLQCLQAKASSPPPLSGTAPHSGSFPLRCASRLPQPLSPHPHLTPVLQAFHWLGRAGAVRAGRTARLGPG